MSVPSVGDSLAANVIWLLLQRGDRLRLLVVHNRYQQMGGEDVVVAAEQALLRGAGHEVSLLEVNNDHIQGALSRIVTAAESVYSFSGKALVGEAIRAHRPDLVHVHNFFPTLSPAVFLACADANVPVVHTLHNYRIACVASTLFRDGRICEDCITAQSFWPGVQHACYRSSRAGSAVAGLGMALHSRIGTWTSKVSAYIALTEFAADKVAEFRVPRNKIFVKPNFVHDRGLGGGGGSFALFVGRLTPEKGIQTLLDADLARALPIDVVLLGDGPMRPAVERAAARPESRIKFKGFTGREETLTYMRQAQVLLLPSLWYEGDPLVVIEAYSLGLPVIAASAGNTATVLRREGTGLAYTAGDAAALSATLAHYIAQPGKVQQMRSRARSYYLSTHTPEVALERLLAIYAQAGAPVS